MKLIQLLKNYSTNDSLLKHTYHFCTNFEDKSKCIGGFLDLAKAFDTVNRSLLLQNYIMVEALSSIHLYFIISIRKETRFDNIFSRCNNNCSMSFTFLDLY